MPCKEKKKEDNETSKERRIEGKAVLCGVVAHNLKKTTMIDVKEEESDIAEACMVFHKRHEQKTGRPIKTISEFQKVIRDFSKLPKEEIEKLIKESKEEDKKT